jgi:hypothetical protein
VKNFTQLKIYGKPVLYSKDFLGQEAGRQLTLGFMQVGLDKHTRDIPLNMACFLGTDTLT